MLTLALDAGSSSVRAALYDSAGVRVEGSLAQVDVDLTTSVGGIVQIDAALMREAVEQAIDTTLGHPAVAGGIGVVGMTTFWHSLVVLDDGGKPLTPVLSWADTRSEPDANVLRDLLDEDDVHQRTGCILHPSYLPAKIHWLQAQDPHVLERAASFVSFAQYCTATWLGTTATSVSMASGSGLYNHRTESWDDELLATLGLTGPSLGEFLPDPEVLPGVLPAYVARWPALAGVPWRAPIGDGAASNVGSGCVEADLLALMVGTSGAMRRIAREADGPRPVERGIWRYRLDRQHAVTGGALSDGGNVYEWLHNIMQLPDEETCERELAKREPGQHGLVILPFWSGERSTGWVGDATAAIIGLTHHTTPLDVLQASLEAISYRFAALFDSLRSGMAAETIIASGGGLRESPAWLQIMTDALGHEIEASSAREASLKGAALVAMRDTGVVNALPRATGGTRYQPDERRHQLHLAARQRQQMLYEREVGPRGVNLLARQTRG